MTEPKLPIGTFPETVPVLYENCLHRARIFSPSSEDPKSEIKARYKLSGERQAIKDFCWSCRQNRKSD